MEMKQNFFVLRLRSIATKALPVLRILYFPVCVLSLLLLFLLILGTICYFASFIRELGNLAILVDRGEVALQDVADISLGAKAKSGECPIGSLLGSNYSIISRSLSLIPYLALYDILSFCSAILCTGIIFYYLISAYISRRNKLFRLFVIDLLYACPLAILKSVLAYYVAYFLTIFLLGFCAALCRMNFDFAPNSLAELIRESICSIFTVYVLGNSMLKKA